MKVIKRDGRTELLDITKIQKYTSSAVKDLVGVSQSELEVDAKILFKDGITTEEIQQTLIKTAVDKIDIDTPNWTFVASRLFLYDLYHKVSGFTGYKHLRDYFEKCMNENKILKGFSDKFDLDLLNDYIKPERDLQFNYLGIKTLYDRYLLKDRDDKPIELPQHMFMAIAMFLAQNEKDCNKKAMEFYDVLSKFEVMVATPTLSNARTPRHQLSSCYVGSMPDNIEGIFDSYKEMALLSKYGGGIGYDVSKIRGLGSYIDNHKNVSGGVVPFLKITNDIAVAVDQLGCVAKDSYVIVLDYIRVKENNKIIDVKYYESYRDKNYQYDYPFDDVIEQAIKYTPEHRGYTKEFITNVIKEHLLCVHKPRKEILDKLNISLDVYKRIIRKFNNTEKELPKGFKIINGISDELDNEYAINEDGFMINIRKFNILKINQNQRGYSTISLKNNYKIHQLVYKTFIGEISKNKQIDHIDNNKTNNNYKNLQEMSSSNNNSKSWDSNREQRILKIKTSGYLNGKKITGKRSKNEIEILDKVSKIIPLSKVSTDDYILSFNIKTGKPEFKKVLKTHKVIVEPKDQIKIIYEDGNYIITSNWHPLCIKENNEYKYKRSDSVKVGDIGVGNNGDKKIVAIDNNPNISSKYLDLTVDGNNNYFCSTHNKNGEFHLIHNTRKGAIAVYLEVWHTDVLDFIDLRKNSGEERRRTHDLFPALWICDLFMKRVQENGLWTLFDPYEVSILTDVYGDEFERKYIEFENRDDIHKETMSAKDLWKKILTNYFESGLPFLAFKDNANRTNPNNHSGIIRSSNLCTEIYQNTLPSNYSVLVHFEDGTTEYFEENDIFKTDDGIEKKANKLTSLDSIYGRKIYAVEKIGTGGETAVCNLASINLSKVNTKEDIERVVPIAIRMLDNVIDLNFYPNLKVKFTNSYNRAIGLGVMGEAEMLAREQIEWGSDKHLNRVDEIMEYISFNAINASSNLAKEKGVYHDYEGSNWSKGILPIDLANKNALELLDRPLSCDWNSLKDKVKSQGMRNGYLMAIAPTSSISILVGTTQTIEPIYKKKWLEENLSGMIPNVVPNLNLDTYNYYVSAYSLDQRDIIKVASIRQKWIDQGQSVNIFMELDKASGKYLNDIYMLAWELGLKSTYYLRSQSPDVKDEAMDRSIECYNCQ